MTHLSALTATYAATYTPNNHVVGGNLALTALVGVLPLLAFFVFLMVLKWKAHWSAIGAAVVALLLAVLAYSMPADLAVLSLTQGIAFGVFPIVFIIWMAVWIYDLTVKSGRFEDMRIIFSKIGRGDMRVQAMLIGFAFGGLLEALAGFGAPVAIVASMLLAIGMKPMKAVLVTFVANAAPVAFGAMAIPVTTSAGLSNQPADLVASMAGRQVSVLAFVVPFVLLLIMDGRRGVRQCWPMALVLGTCFGGGQFLASNYFTYELTDVVACLLSLVVGIAFLRVWGPTTPQEQASVNEHSGTALTAPRAALALFPYVFIVVVFAITSLVKPLNDFLNSPTVKIPWPGLDGNLLTVSGEASTSTVFNFNWLSNPGTILFFCGVVTVIVYTVCTSSGAYPLGLKAGFTELFVGLNRMKMSYVTIAAVMGLAYVMNFSGQTAAIGALLAATGSFFPLLAPILGWLGTAVTGSATSSNALFAQMQATTAETINAAPHLLVAANSAGAVLGKMISPQTVALAAAAVRQEGSESAITARAAKYSLGLLVFICVLVYLQSTSVLGWMVP